MDKSFTRDDLNGYRQLGIRTMPQKDKEIIQDRVMTLGKEGTLNETHNISN